MRFGWFWLLMLFALNGRAQTPYGNEWIRPEQSYLRLGIIRDGWYQLKAGDLQQYNIDPATIAPQSLQLYRRGQEVAIRVQGEADGRLDAADYIEFYGQHNDGLLDSLLYDPPQAQPHTYYSLYSDTATYFLTWRSVDQVVAGPKGQRIAQVPAPSPVGKALYHDEKVRQIFTSEYPAGNIYPPGAGYDDGYILSPYDYGEGWTGPARQTNQWETLRLQTLNPVREAFERSEVEILFVGRNAGTHRVEVWVGDASKRSRKLGEIQWKNYGTQLFRANLTPDDLSATNQLSLAYVPLEPEESVSASYVEWTYPQRIEFSSAENQKLLHPARQEAIALNRPDSLLFFDITKPSHPRQLGLAARKDTLFVSPGVSQSLLVVKNPLSVSNIQSVHFPSLDSANIDYLIITHPLVRTPVTGSADPVTDYAAYRASEAGGHFTPLVLNASEVADHFNYGEPGPVGTRRLMRWLHDKGKLRYMFLMGRSRSPQAVRKQANARSEDMIPSAGWPDSDIALGMGLDSINPDVPLVPIGRLNAYNAQNVWDYFQKVKQHEAAPAAAPWRKNILHLSGGRSGSELSTFRSYVDDYTRQIIPSVVGPALQTISKKTDEPVERFAIAPQINEGVALMTLFGHSSLDITDIDIGFASNDALGYRNAGRYPAVLVNGCALGNFYYGPTPISTDWVLTPNRGAVLFLAHTHNGLSAAMYRYSQGFYDALADPVFASRGFGDIMQEGIRRYLKTNNTLSDRITAQQMNLQGDPAIKIFPATRPDYTGLPSTFHITNSTGGTPTAWDDSLRVSAEIANYGRVENQNYIIQLRRIRDSQTIATYTLNRPGVPLRDSLRLTIPNNSRQGGNETWELSLDPENVLDEEDETNNLLTTQIRVAEGGAIPLLPADRSVIPRSQVELVAQLPQFRANARVIFEWDTSPTLGSNPQRDTVTARGVLARRMLALSGPPPQTLYWRVRIVGDSIQPPRSFTYDPKGGTFPLPEGVATVEGSFSKQLEEGERFSAQIAFQNLTEVPFRDSIQVLVREFQDTDVIEKQFSIPPLGANATHEYTYEQGTLGQAGLNRVLIQFNTGQLPEQLYANNVVELAYTVRPDQTPPVLDVLVDERRLRDEEVVSPQPTLQIHILDSNPYLLRADTTGLRVSIRQLCDQCPEVPLALDQAQWVPAPAADFGVTLPLPQLTSGTYLLTVQARDVKGNEAAPYQIRFRVTDQNKVVSAMASPNPADLWIKFSLELEGKNAPDLWQVYLFDLTGKALGTLSKKPTLGQNELVWVPASLAPGLYLYKMKLEGAEWPASVVGQGKVLYSR
ncbi:putative type IX secretion system sortase PorU2 [Salmonirosea aquatica]|uniref:Gingipain domain-containing protein n=1 Tax=Salmonirosea aquatica TaxID=2654236 RepID=A0A7C9FNR4_9BACT|nr:hypothetical protein [Cytophagaceae bacterium SJW1-29]